MPRWMAICLWICIFIHRSKGSGKLEQQRTKSTLTRRLSILLVAPPFPGHLIPMASLGEELVRRGHNVTLCTTVVKGSNLLSSIINQTGLHFWSAGDADFLTAEQTSNASKELRTFWDAVQLFFTLIGEVHKRLFQTLDTPALRSFDILVCDWGLTVATSLTWKWDIRTVTLWRQQHAPFDLPPWPFPMVGTGFDDELQFYQRLILAIHRPLLKLVVTVKAPPYVACNVSHLKVITAPGHYVPMIVGSVIGIEFPRSISPLTHYVGPILSQKLQDLPLDMQEWLNQKAVKSVVYVSMGSTGYLTRDMAQALMDGIAMANYSVLWSLRKSDEGILQFLNIDNEKVFVASWVPQLTVLKHHGVSLAVLHGGMNGIQEALSCGVPILAVTHGLFDQGDHVARVQHFKYGEVLYPQDVTATRVLEKLKTIDTELYRSSISKVQLIFKQAGGASRAAELIEFYAEVGYDHLLPAYARYDWSWVQYYNADVYVVLILAAAFLSWFMYRIVYRIYKTFHQ